MSRPPDRIPTADIALFLDVDGTLVEIEEEPDAVFASPALIEQLHDASAALDGALALVSGRGLAELDRMFSPAVFDAAGAHGSELRLDGMRLPEDDGHAPPESAVVALQAFADRHEGILLEKKSTGVSLHYRRAPALENDSRAIVGEILAELGEGFRLIDGKKVLEIAPAAHNKGEAIRRFVAHGSFSGRMPVFVGDDVTDEDGFRAVNELGGLSIRVGPLDESEARHSLADVNDVHRWLAQVMSP